MKTFSAYETNNDIHHGSSANVVRINGVVCNKLVPPGYSLYFNVRGYKMVGTSSFDDYTYVYSANAMRYHNRKTETRFIKSATPYYFWIDKNGTKTAAKPFATWVSEKNSRVDNTKKTMRVNSTYTELHVFIRVVVGPNKDNSNNTETYDTNEVLLCKYGTYTLDFLRTPTKMNNAGLHYITNQEFMSLIGHRFVLVNNTGTDVFMINRSDLAGSGDGYTLTAQEPSEPQTHSMIRISNNTSLGFTLVCEDYKYAETINGTSVRFPLIYWKPDEFYNGMLKNSDLTTDVWGGDILLE